MILAQLNKAGMFSQPCLAGPHSKPPIGMRGAFQAEDAFTYREETPDLPMVLATKGAVDSLHPGCSINPFDARYVGWA